MTDIPYRGQSYVARLRTRRNRRALALFYVAVLGALLAITALIDSYLPVIPLAALYVTFTLLLNLSTRSIAGQATDALDEQQVSIRNAAYQRSYWAGTMVAFLGGIGVAGLSDTDTAFEVGLFLAVWGLLSGLPMLVVAWTLPEEAGDEE